MKAATHAAADAFEAPVPRAPLWDRVVVAGLGSALVWAPIPLGSNRMWAAALLAIGMWSLVLVHTGFRARQGAPRAADLWARALWLLLPLGLYTALVGLQMAAGQTGWAGLIYTLEVAQTRFKLFVVLACLAAALAVLLCAHNTNRVRQILFAVMAAGVVQAGLAVFLNARRDSYQFLFHTLGGGGRVSGTFPNPDHLAGYMELCLSAGFGLLVAQFGHDAGKEKGHGWQHGLKQAMDFVLSPKMLLRLTLVAMVVALVMTHSRMGNGAFFIALLLVGVVVAIVSRKLRKAALWLVASMVVIDVFIIGQMVGLDRVVERMQNTAASTAVQAEVMALPDFGGQPKEESLQQRLTVPRLAAALVPAHPWFGTGAGTFYLAFPGVKPAGFPHVWDHAHNDYVEFATDTGLVGLGLLLLAALATTWRALRMLRDSQPRLHRGVAAAALMALTCLALHSIVDFNLQIPANAMTLVVLMALVWAIPADHPLEQVLTRGPRRRFRIEQDNGGQHGASATGPRPSPRRLRRGGGDAAAAVSPRMRGERRRVWVLAATCAALVWLGAAWKAVPTVLADFGSLQARAVSSTCALSPGKYTLTELQAVERQLLWAQSVLPDAATFSDGLADVLACQGALKWEDVPASVALYRRSVDALRQSLALRSDHGATWAQMAMTLYGADAQADELWGAWRAARKHGPREALVQVNLMDLGLRLWPVAPPDVRQWVSAQFTGATPDNRKVLQQMADRLGHPEAFDAVR